MMALRAVLWSVHAGLAPVAGVQLGKPSLPHRTGISEAFYEAVGYRVLGARAVRVDIVEHVSARAARCAGTEPWCRRRNSRACSAAAPRS